MTTPIKPAEPLPRNPVNDAIRDKRLSFFNPPENNDKQQYTDAWFGRILSPTPIPKADDG